MPPKLSIDLSCAANAATSIAFRTTCFRRVSATRFTSDGYFATALMSSSGSPDRLNNASMSRQAGKAVDAARAAASISGPRTTSRITLLSKGELDLKFPFAPSASSPAIRSGMSASRNRDR